MPAIVPTESASASVHIFNTASTPLQQIDFGKVKLRISASAQDVWEFVNCKAYIMHCPQQQAVLAGRWWRGGGTSS